MKEAGCERAHIVGFHLCGICRKGQAAVIGSKEVAAKGQGWAEEIDRKGAQGRVRRAPSPLGFCCFLCEMNVGRHQGKWVLLKFASLFTEQTSQKTRGLPWSLDFRLKGLEWTHPNSLQGRHCSGMKRETTTRSPGPPSPHTAPYLMWAFANQLTAGWCKRL